MRAEAKFAKPDDAQVTITLRGTLKEFTDLSTAISADAKVPYWQSRALVDAISEAAWKLRGAVAVECDSGSDPQGENSRSEVECEASQSGLKGIAQTPGETP